MKEASNVVLITTATEEEAHSIASLPHYPPLFTPPIPYMARFSIGH